SFRQLLQPLPNKRRGVGTFTGIARGGSNCGSGLRLAITEIDQGGDGVGDWPRRTLLIEHADKVHHRRIDIGKGRNLSFNSVTMRSATFWPTPGERATVALSRIATAEASSEAFNVLSTDIATLAPTPCTVCSVRNHSRSMLLGNPNSLIWSSRT